MADAVGLALLVVSIRSPRPSAWPKSCMTSSPCPSRRLPRRSTARRKPPVSLRAARAAPRRSRTPGCLRSEAVDARGAHRRLRPPRRAAAPGRGASRRCGPGRFGAGPRGGRPGGRRPGPMFADPAREIRPTTVNGTAGAVILAGADNRRRDGVHRRVGPDRGNRRARRHRRRPPRATRPQRRTCAAGLTRRIRTGHHRHSPAFGTAIEADRHRPSSARAGRGRRRPRAA